VLELTLYIGVLTDVSAVLDKNIEGSGAIALLGKLDLIIVLIVSAVGQKNLNDLHQQLPDVVNEFMGSFEVLFQLDTAILYDLVVEHQLALNWIIGQKILTTLQAISVFVIVVSQCFGVDVRDHVRYDIMLLENGSDGALDVAITLHKLRLLVEDIGAEVADVLDLLLEVHELERSQVLQITDGPAEPESIAYYIGWKSPSEIKRFGCWLCSFRHRMHPTLNASLQVLKRQTNTHFSLCYRHNTFICPPSFVDAFIEL
jgi:hypothetical protein